MRVEQWRCLPILAMMILCVLGFAACGQKEESAQAEPDHYEIALITDEAGVEDGAFLQTTWNAITAFAEENAMTCQYYRAQEASDESYMQAISEAVDGGGKLIILAGSQFETTAFRAQKAHRGQNFVLLDGVPRDKDYHYETASNSTGVLFAEEQAGYLAGYAAVYDGYRHLGFMGGEELPAVKRYGLGFLQGAADAAEELQVSDVTVNYIYTGTFLALETVREKAADWYEDGTEVIFACGGAIGESVMKAAEQQDGKVIGVDADQSAQSETVITSATKGIRIAITDILKGYRRNNFRGGAIYNYSAENDGIGLEITNARFMNFTPAQYEAVYRDLKEGSRSVSKDLEKDTPKSVAGDALTLTMDKMKQ